MLKQGVGAIGAAILVGSAAIAQDAAAPETLELGQQIYAESCALCHQDAGVGDPPAFPALAGNAQLADVGLIVRNVHLGQGNMPPFPELTPEELAEVATFIRTSWTNDFGPVTADEVATALEGLEVAGEQASVWDGVYTAAQADRGMAAYRGPCGLCHGRRLNGAPDDPDMRSTPPLARAPFLRDWYGKSLATLFEYTRATMPLNNPGYMSDQQYVDILAHMLEVSGMPTGPEELPPDPGTLARIVIEPETQ